MLDKVMVSPLYHFCRQFGRDSQTNVIASCLSKSSVVEYLQLTMGCYLSHHVVADGCCYRTTNPRQRGGVGGVGYDADQQLMSTCACQPWHGLSFEMLWPTAFVTCMPCE